VFVLIRAMVLRVAVSDRGWILVDGPPPGNNNSNTSSSISFASSTQWVFGCILPSLLLGLSSGMLLQEFIRSSRAGESIKKTKTTTTTTNAQAMIKMMLTTDWLQPLQHYWENHRKVVRSVASQWWWLLLLPCKSSTSWTLGPLAAYGCFWWWNQEDEDAADDDNEGETYTRKFWNTATSTTATVASSQASVTAEWAELQAAAAAAMLGSAKHQLLQQQQQAPKRYLELLVHNVAHTDMILSLEAPSFSSSMDTSAVNSFCMVDHPNDKMNDDMLDDDEAKNTRDNNRHHHHDASEFCLCRPRFSAFAAFSSLVAKALPDPPTNDMLIHIDRFERMEDADTGGYHIVTPRNSNSTDPPLPATTTATTTSTEDASSTSTCTTKPLPTGFRLNTSNPHLMIPQEQWSDLRVRGRDAPRVEHCPLAGLPLNAVFFPLLAILLPKWQQQMAQKYHDTNLLPNHVKQVLLLVTGVGTPRNSTHDVKGNSTELLGVLMEQFVKLLYPHITVVRIHSETNLFRYDENIGFVEQELMPCIHSYRDAHARGLPYPDEVLTPSTQDMVTSSNAPPFDPDWYKSFALTLSFADGSHARTHAIQASLRVSYRPTYFHVWQLKTFWHVGKLVDDDIEVYSFEEMETSPALEPSSALCPMTKLVWEEMKDFKEEFVACMKRGGNDIANFWLRKTRQPVLAVLLVQSSSSNENDGRLQKPRLYRGTNMEVSMPTGSLCAERNVIGSALADNPSLKREDLKFIAVLQVPLEEMMVEKTTAALVMKHSSSFISYSSVNAMDVDEDWVPTTDEQSVNTSSSGVEHHGQPALPPVVSFTGGPAIPPPPAQEPPSTPIRRIHLYPQGNRNIHPNANTAVKTKSGDMMARKQKKTVVVHSAVVRELG
jgi:hypothetical protein